MCGTLDSKNFMVIEYRWKKEQLSISIESKRETQYRNVCVCTLQTSPDNVTVCPETVVDNARLLIYIVNL